MTSAEKLTLGEILIQEGLLTKEQLAEVLMVQKQQSRYRPLGELCIERGLITRDELKRTLKLHKKGIRLGELLVNLGIITQNQLSEALKKQRDGEKRLGEVLIEMGLISDEELARGLSLQLDIPYMKPDVAIIDKRLLSRAKEAFLRGCVAVPCVEHEGVVTVVAADPLREDIAKDLGLVYGCKVELAVAARSEILSVLDDLYAPLEIKEGAGRRQEAPSRADLVIGGMAATVAGDHTVSIVNHLIANAIKEKASDIHIESLVDKVRVRYRIDGILQHKTDFPVGLGFPLVSRVKVLSGMDIAEHRRHQDGRIEAKVMGRDVDLRVSVFASVYGENAVIRILQRQTPLIELETLGFSPGVKRRYENLLDHPTGIILVTGPTGSGKTTTLYASLAYLNRTEKKIITVEDPVEVTIDGVVQGMLNPKLHQSYMDFIKSMMRQDPDVIMIGEIRDREVAQATIEAGLTGHKVFSTFHTEDSVGALLRLIDMGIDPFMVNTTVAAVLAQRLVRVVCPKCRVAQAPDQQLLDFFRLRGFRPNSHSFYGGAGCPECSFTGFRGRTAIHELLIINDTIRAAVLAKKDSIEINRVARARAGLVTLKEDGLFKALCGITAPGEVFRVAHYVETDESSYLEVDQVMSACQEGA